jgi:predicted O-methyltransferase YrrM
MIKDYLRYVFNSHNRHGVHSPFVYELNEHVFNQKPGVAEMQKVNAYRSFLKSNSIKLIIDDLGSGSHEIKTSERVVNNIYKTASTNSRMGEILYRLIKYYRFRNILEIGTCLGVGTAYMQSAIKDTSDARITTIEGSHSLVEFTKSNFNNYFNDSKVDFLEGNFDILLPQILPLLPPIDLALVDGNHTYKATLNYFNLLVGKTHNDSVIIFDDIYWSEEMKNAWIEIKQYPGVTCSVDLFRWGMVFFRKEMRKEHFTLRFDGFLKAHIGQ